MTDIVVGVDGSESSAQALVWAHREAELHNWPLTAVMAWGLLDQHHTTPGERFDPSYDQAAALIALDAYVKDAVGSSGAANVQRRAECDLAAPALLKSAEGASLLVVGARGFGGFRGLLLGSVSQHCLHHATCPVAVVRHSDATAEGDDQERIVVGVDGSDTARRALRWAVDEAILRRATLEVVHAWHMPYLDGGMFSPAVFDPRELEEVATASLDAALEGIDTTALVQPVGRVLTNGGAASAILEAAKAADLVVMGSRGLGGFSGLLLGSVSYQVAHHAPCPVVIVPSER
jgi:nucleotide-binding universal stress UspA family protein